MLWLSAFGAAALVGVMTGIVGAMLKWHPMMSALVGFVTGATATVLVIAIGT